MADLPIERLGYKEPPFSNTGVDYFGPLLVPIRRSTEKRWDFLFTCLTTRAVHIEVVPSLDTNSCVMVGERFIARHGTPTTIMSDNGTNFVGAQKELLTPNHFILGQHAASFPSLSFKENFDHNKRFARAQPYANAKWIPWMWEYVHSLNRRSKWHNQSDVKLKTGDLVWIIEPDTPRGHYPLARILRLHYGKDGCTRSADIKTVTSELTRPTVKLAPVFPCLVVEDVAAQM